MIGYVSEKPTQSALIREDAVNDPLSIAARLIEYANERGISDRKREDLLAAADMARVLNGMLNAVEEHNGRLVWRRDC